MTPLDRIESKLDKVVETQTEQAVTLERCVATMEHHVKRSDATDAHLELLRATVDPLVAIHNRWAGAGKLTAMVGAAITVAAALVAVLEGLAHVWGHFK